MSCLPLSIRHLAGVFVASLVVGLSLPALAGEPRSIGFTRYCPFVPEPACLGVVEPGGARLDLKRHPKKQTRDKLVWTLKRGDLTTLGDLGDPLATTTFELCVYVEQSPGVWSLFIHPDAAAGPGWKAKRTGYRYKARTGENADGVRKLKLRAGSTGRTKLKLQAKGLDLAMPALPLPAASTVRVQLHSSDASCWDAVYSGPPRKNDERRFRAHSD